MNITDAAMDLIKVVCGIIKDDEKYFVCRRKPEKSQGGYWEFPGGKIEPHESSQVALIRELEEELKMEVEILDHIGTSMFTYEKFNCELQGFLCSLKSYEGFLSDHDEFAWVGKEEMDQLKMAPADRPLIELIP